MFCEERGVASDVLHGPAPSTGVVAHPGHMHPKSGPCQTWLNSRASRERLRNDVSNFYALPSTSFDLAAPGKSGTALCIISGFAFLPQAGLLHRYLGALAVATDVLLGWRYTYSWIPSAAYEAYQDDYCFLCSLLLPHRCRFHPLDPRLSSTNNWASMAESSVE